MLDVKVKGVNMGRTKKEGWRRKVLNISECQLETKPTMIPGKITARLRLDMENIRVPLTSDSVLFSS